MHNPWINYHHLFYFKTVAEEGTVSKAATKLHIGQPTLSAQLKQFEENLGVPLFERQHKKLTLTEQGRVALDYAKNIFKLGSEMYEVLHDGIKPLKPFVHLGALDSVPKEIVHQLVNQALTISPCQITLSEGNFNFLLRELSAHHIDMVITNFLPTGIEAKGLYTRSISKTNVSFYGSPKYKTLKKQFPQSISGQPIMVPTYDSRLRQDLDHWAKMHKVDLNIITETQDISVNKLMAINNLGLFPAGNDAVSAQIKSGELIEIGSLKGIQEEVFLITAQRKIQNPIAAKLIETFKIK